MEMSVFFFFLINQKGDPFDLFDLVHLTLDYI